jgi:hypothetical protein
VADTVPGVVAPKLTLSMLPPALGFINTVPADPVGTILTASAGTINNTKVGNTKPSTATFTVANVQAKPVSPTGAANKKYVDNRATALAIALGS